MLTLKEVAQPAEAAVKSKSKTVFIPQNLDVEKLLNDYPPQGYKLSADRIKFIICLLAEMPFRDRRLMDDFQDGRELPFIPLHSGILKSKIYNYHQYLGYLINIGILEGNNQYFVDVVSKGYRLTEKYRGLVKKEKINEPSLFNNLTNESWGRLEAKRKHPELISWFDLFEFDHESASSYLDKLFEHEQAQYRFKIMDALFARHNTYRVMIERCAEKDFFFTVDLFANRFHTILSNLKSELRNFVSYKGQKLCAVDLSGSQPFLVLNLLDPNFYSESNESETINLKKINFNIDPPISSPHPGPPISSIMCGVFDDETVPLEIQMFKDWVKNNEFYESCMEVMTANNGKKVSRKKMKDIIFSVLFSSNDSESKGIVKNKELFQQLFPFITSVLTAWKHERGNNLAQVLQRIESYLFLDCIVPRINAEMPELPIFTVHDSVVTLESHLDYVRAVMRDEIKKKTDYNPHFKFDVWKIENVMEAEKDLNVQAG